MEGGARLLVVRACSTARLKVQAYLRSGGRHGQWGLCEKGVRLEWDDTRNDQDMSVMQMDLEQKDWWQ